MEKTKDVDENSTLQPTVYMDTDAERGNSENVHQILNLRRTFENSKSSPFCRKNENLGFSHGKAGRIYLKKAGFCFAHSQFNRLGLEKKALALMKAKTLFFYRFRLFQKRYLFEKLFCWLEVFERLLLFTFCVFLLFFIIKIFPVLVFIKK